MGVRRPSPLYHRGRRCDRAAAGGNPAGEGGLTMTGRHEARPLRARGLLALACGVALLWSATPAAQAEPAAGAQNVPMIHRLLDPLEQFLVPKCITPAVDRVFNDLVAARAFQPVLGDGFTLERVEAHVDQIELEIQDGTHR